MVCYFTGKAVVSSDGMTIVEALQPEHPVAHLVLQALKNCHSVTLDGSKLFLLYLSNMLIYLQQEIDQGSFLHHGTNLKLDTAGQHGQSMVCAQRNLKLLINSVIPELYKDVFAHCRTLGLTMKTKFTVQDIMKNILRTAIMPHYSVPQCEFYSQLILSCLPVDRDSRTLAETLQLMVDKFNNIVIKVSNRPYRDCTAFKMLLIKQCFKYKNQKTLTVGKQLAVILNCDSYFIVDDDDTDSMMIKQSCTIDKMVKSRRKVIENFVESCVKKNINIVLCTGSLPNYAVNIFNRHELSVVTNVIEEDLEILQLCSGKIVINDLTEEIEDINAVTLSSIAEVVIGGRQYIQLQIADSLVSLKHIIVCAPTIGLCDQLAVTLHKALNALKSSLRTGTSSLHQSFCYNESLLIDTPYKNKEPVSVNDCRLSLNSRNMISSPEDCVINSDIEDYDENENYFNVIEGGTSFEILLANLAQNYAQDCENSDLSILCKILDKTLVSVVRTLYKNTNTQPASKQGFLKTETLLKEKVSTECIWGLDRRGTPCCLMDRGVLEPVTIKFHTLNCVLNLVCQLLGVDKIVSVKKIKD